MVRLLKLSNRLFSLWHNESVASGLFIHNKYVVSRGHVAQAGGGRYDQGECVRLAE